MGIAALAHHPKLEERKSRRFAGVGTIPTRPAENSFSGGVSRESVFRKEAIRVRGGGEGEYTVELGFPSSKDKEARKLAPEVRIKQIGMREDLLSIIRHTSSDHFSEEL